LQSLNGLARERIKALPTAIEMIDDRRSHARIPIFFQVIRDAGNGLIVTLAREKLADLIGHV